MATAIVTGGAKRIGAEIARALAADGWHVLIHYNRSRAEAEALAAELGNASVVQAELADPRRGRRRSSRRWTACRRRGCWSTMPRSSPMTTSAISRPKAGPPISTSTCARRLCCRGPSRRGPAHGLIVNLLDAKLAAPNPDFFSYTISKIGLAGLTELCARAFAPGIRVCGIAPSVTMVSGPQSRANFDKVHGLNALGRGVDVDEIVAALRFIIATPSLTGQTILLDGGQRFLSLPRDVQFLEPE